MDGVCDVDDLCPGFDDNIDTDMDGIPDGCDDAIFVSNDISSSFENADLLISDIGMGVLMKNSLGDQYLLQVNGAGLPTLILNNTLLANTYLPSGDLFIISPGRSVIFRRDASNYTEISVSENGDLVSNNTTVLPNQTVDLSLGHLGMSEVGAGIVFKNALNTCYKMYVNSEGTLAINPTVCPE
jgi:hypothetical protein